MSNCSRAMHMMQERLRQEREMQPVCRKCKTKHFVIAEEGISCCPLDDIRFIRRFYTKKMNFPSASLVLGDDVLEFHVDPELFFFEKAFSLNVFEKVPFQMISKLVECEDVSDLYERLLALPVIKVNSMTNMISLTIILDYLKLFLSYPRQVQAQMLTLRNKLVLDNLKKDATKSKGTQFLELFLTLMNRYWVHNKELDETIGLFDWTGLFEYKKNDTKPYFKIKGKKLMIPFLFEDDSNMEYIHPYKRNLLPDNNDRGMIMNTESGLCWIDANWVSHPVPEELYCKVVNGDQNGRPSASNSTAGTCPHGSTVASTSTNVNVSTPNPLDAFSGYSAGVLTEHQTDQLVKAMYIAHCMRRATEKEQPETFTPISSNFIIPKDDDIAPSVPLLPANHSSVPFSSAPLNRRVNEPAEESRGTQLAEAFGQFHSRLVMAERERTSNASQPEPPAQPNPFGDNVYIPLPMPPMLQLDKGSDDEYYSVGDNEEKKMEYLEFIERNYGALARDAVANQLLPHLNTSTNSQPNENVGKTNKSPDSGVGSQLEGAMKNLTLQQKLEEKCATNPDSASHSVPFESRNSGNRPRETDRTMRDTEALDMENLLAETLAKKLTSVFISHGVPCQTPVLPLHEMKNARKNEPAVTPSAPKPKPTVSVPASMSKPAVSVPAAKPTPVVSVQTPKPTAAVSSPAPRPTATSSRPKVPVANPKPPVTLVAPSSKLHPSQATTDWSTIQRITTTDGKTLMGVNPYPPRPYRPNRNLSPNKFLEARRAQEAKKSMHPKPEAPRIDSRKPVGITIIKKLQWTRPQIVNALMKRTPSQFIDLKRLFATNAEDSVWAIESGVYQLRNLIDEENIVQETYAEWKKRNEDLISRFRLNSLHLLDNIDYSLKPAVSE